MHEFFIGLHNLTLTLSHKTCVKENLPLPVKSMFNISMGSVFGLCDVLFSLPVYWDTQDYVLITSGSDADC